MYYNQYNNTAFKLSQYRENRKLKPFYIEASFINETNFNMVITYLFIATYYFLIYQ